MTDSYDSQAARGTALGLCSGNPPRSGIEWEPKRLLLERPHLDTAISWVRSSSHIGITRNKLADKRAAWERILILGETAGSPQTTTEGGLRQQSKATRQAHMSGTRQDTVLALASPSPFSLHLDEDGTGPPT